MRCSPPPILLSSPKPHRTPTLVPAPPAPQTLRPPCPINPSSAPPPPSSPTYLLRCSCIVCRRQRTQPHAHFIQCSQAGLRGMNSVAKARTVWQRLKKSGKVWETKILDRGQEMVRNTKRKHSTRRVNRPSIFHNEESSLHTLCPTLFTLCHTIELTTRPHLALCQPRLARMKHDALLRLLHLLLPQLQGHLRCEVGGSVQA